MNNEIKEILHYLKNDDYSPVFEDEGCDDTPYKLFEECEIKVLLDYITNLQQKNKNLSNKIDDIKNTIKSMLFDVTGLDRNTNVLNTEQKTAIKIALEHLLNKFE